MPQTVMNLDPTDSLARFDAAMDALMGHLGRVLAEDGAKTDPEELSALHNQVKF